MCADSEGSGETARMRRLAWAFAGRLCYKYHNLMDRLNYCYSLIFDLNRRSYCHAARGSFFFFFVKVFFSARIVCNRSMLFEPPHDKTNKVACAPSEDSDQPWHPPSLSRVFTVHMKKAWFLSYPLSAHRRLRSHWADAQADLSFRWAYSHFVGFVMRQLILLSAFI